MQVASRSTRRVLLIEDDFLLREVITLTLAAEGYMVATAADGGDAFERLRRYERPDLILLDLMMPGMNGERFRAEQQQDPALASIPVVILSAAGDIEQQAAALGISDYLQKPVETQKLLETIRRRCGPAASCPETTPV